MDRNTFLEINVNNLYHNLDTFNNNTGKKMMAVLKANGYGLIDYKIASFLEEKGVDFFGVALLDEALRLREHNIKSNILILDYVKDLKCAKDNDFSIITPSLEYVEKNINELKGVRVHIKVNTGLNRLGVNPEETKKTLELLLNAGAIVEGIMTHYACNNDVDYTYSQYYLFKDIVEKLNYDFKYIHTASVDAALYLEDEISNYVRVGLGLFGLANIEHNWDLRQVMAFKSEVLYCRKVAEGDGVSYGHEYISDGTGYISTIAAGFADGIKRSIKNHRVYIGEEEGFVAGNICMDLMMVHTNNYHAPGELVEIIGERISVKERELDCNTCCSDIMCSVSNRVTRVYIKDNIIIDKINERY